MRFNRNIKLINKLIILEQGIGLSGYDDYIFTPYIVKNGKYIYRKNGGMFRIPISNLKKK